MRIIRQQLSNQKLLKPLVRIRGGGSVRGGEELEESGGHGSKAGFASALNSAVSTDVAQMLASKSAAELDELREQISAQLQVGSMHRDARPPAPPPLCRLDCFAMIASHVLPSHSSGR